MSTRDIGQDDFENTVTIPGPMIRSRHVGTESVVDDGAEAEGLTDELRCATCGRRYPGVATHCPEDGTALVAVAKAASPPED